MGNPLISIIIPTHNRQHLVPHAVKSALEQTIEDLEVIVIDDASEPPVDLADDPRLRVIRKSENNGIAAVRNAGALAARGRWITYLDDDDRLLPYMAAACLKAIADTQLPKPIAVLSTKEVVNAEGEVLERRVPPTLPRGKHFFLEEIPPEKSFLSKQTLFIERDTLLGIAGYDETFQTREHTEMFLRLNPVCSILGIPVVTYKQLAHSGSRLSRNPSHRQVDFIRLVRKHKSLFKSHPKTFVDFVYAHVVKSKELGQKRAALLSLCWTFPLAPIEILKRFFQEKYHRIQRRLSTFNLLITGENG
ncbi:glycosyltransferase family 2 protein [Mastigocoleus testarum]|uniref:Glycosyl transferase family 2 n=1 Tax=Mastigocoleus testarum BC008 TaxID=371196 RepID=A0A0V7ZZP6_9CYAN|nr:glycosyltransferase family 2 protein [Mastigocoleus testarum]KST69934.1 glycosyl transferase family 2 [Mastigocoleus testarum BC008]KST69949.1 glycosyl transferase family 2 [Mastigocoleus testarum BC008]